MTISINKKILIGSVAVFLSFSLISCGGAKASANNSAHKFSNKNQNLEEENNNFLINGSRNSQNNHQVYSKIGEHPAHSQMNNHPAYNKLNGHPINKFIGGRSSMGPGGMSPSGMGSMGGM